MDRLKPMHKHLIKLLHKMAIYPSLKNTAVHNNGEMKDIGFK